MAGLGGQFCLVWPEQDAVMVKLNPSGREYVEADGPKHITIQQIFAPLHQALTGKTFEAPLSWRVASTAVELPRGGWVFRL
jgi:hypothetical protein